MDTQNGQLYTIEQVSKRLKLSKYTIRYYTNIGLVPNLKRDDDNNRLFDEISIHQLESLIHLRECGMSIKDIQKYCALCQKGKDTFQERYKMIQQCYFKAQKSFLKAQQIFDFAEYKLHHYDDIKLGKIKDDTNLGNFK